MAFTKWDRLKKYFQADHLILPVGGNPLPGYVAARLLAKSTETPITLLFSGGDSGEPSTQDAAVRLEKALRMFCGFENICPIPIDSSDNLKIKSGIQTLVLPSLPKEGIVGLNYSGGTKPMALHTYRTVEEELRKGSGPRLYCSYLDPRKLMLRFDRRIEDKKEEYEFSVLGDDTLREKISLSLKELTGLHGYQPPERDHKILSKVRDFHSEDEFSEISVLSEEIANLYKSENSLREWHTWLSTFGDKSKPVTIPECKKYSSLSEVARVMNNMRNEGAQSTLEDEIVRKILWNPVDKDLRSCSKWFTGGWLEEWAGGAFLRAAKKFQIQDKAMGRNLLYEDDSGKSRDCFELDAAAIYGYQLFALSCINSADDDPKAHINKRSHVIDHLLEIYVRARQLGGDEARIALVCRTDDPLAIERELRRGWDVDGKIKVFGLTDLAQLDRCFLDWFTTANQ
jgi:hypothetical protein